MGPPFSQDQLSRGAHGAQPLTLGKKATVEFLT